MLMQVESSWQSEAFDSFQHSEQQESTTVEVPSSIHKSTSFDMSSYVPTGEENIETASSVIRFASKNNLQVALKHVSINNSNLASYEIMALKQLQLVPHIPRLLDSLITNSGKEHILVLPRLEVAELRKINLLQVRKNLVQLCTVFVNSNCRFYQMYIR